MVMAFLLPSFLASLPNKIAKGAATNCTIRKVPRIVIVLKPRSVANAAAMVMMVPIPLAYTRKVSRNQNKSLNLRISLKALRKRAKPTFQTFSPTSLASAMRVGSCTRRNRGIEKIAHHSATLARLRRIQSMVEPRSPRSGVSLGPKNIMTMFTSSRMPPPM